MNALNLTNPRNCNLRNADKIPREISKLPTAAEGGNSRQIFFLSHKFHRRAKKKLMGNSSGLPLSSCQGSRCVRFEIKPYELPSQIAGTRLSLLYIIRKTRVYGHGHKLLVWYTYIYLLNLFCISYLKHNT